MRRYLVELLRYRAPLFVSVWRDVKIRFRRTLIRIPVVDPAGALRRRHHSARI
jgi:hypothetical protein